MQCAVVFYFVVTIFVDVYTLAELCVIKGHKEKAAYCGIFDVEYTLDFIPPVSQNISYIDLDGQPLKQLPYNAFRNLSSHSSISEIVLRHCQIGYVNADTLLYLRNLRYIDLSHNYISEIGSKLFSHTKQISVIDMEYNKIEELPNGLFHNLILLEVVYLQHNQIYQMGTFLFENTPSLRKIYLNNNKIEFMDMLFEDKFNNLTTLSLYGNPWKCNCKLGPLYEFVRKLNNFNLHELVCKKPPTLHERKWSDISRDKFACHSGNVISTKESVMTSTEPTTITEQDDNVPVTVYVGSMSIQDSVVTSTESATTTEKDDNVPVTVYDGSMSTQDSVVASTEPTTTEADKNVPVTDYNETRCQQVDTGIPQSPVILNWIQYTILGLVLVCVVAVIIGVVFVVRQSLATSNRRRHVLLPTIVTRKFDRPTKATTRVFENGAASENSDSELNTDDVDEESTPIHHYEIREASIT